MTFAQALSLTVDWSNTNNQVLKTDEIILINRNFKQGRRSLPKQWEKLIPRLSSIQQSDLCAYTLRQHMSHVQQALHSFWLSVHWTPSTFRKPIFLLSCMFCRTNGYVTLVFVPVLEGGWGGGNHRGAYLEERLSFNVFGVAFARAEAPFRVPPQEPPHDRYRVGG